MATNPTNMETGEMEFPDGLEPQVFMDSEGREIPNPNPIVIYLPSGPVTDFDRVRELIRRELSYQAALDGEETLEEANDFDVDGDMFPVSPHEYAEETEAADREALEAEVERQRRASSRPKKPKADKPVEDSSESPVQGDSASPGDSDAQ